MRRIFPLAALVGCAAAAVDATWQLHVTWIPGQSWSHPASPGTVPSIKSVRAPHSHTNQIALPLKLQLA